MKKRYARELWRWIRHIHPWYFLIPALIFGAICLTALRHNNERMVELREAVYAADEKNGDVEGAIRALREHIYAHMNTSLTSGTNAIHPPIQLKYTYERVQAAQQSQLGPGNAALYHDAQAYCESQNAGAPAADLVACFENYAASRGVQLTSIPDALYKFDFTSAKWSPDLAGWTLLLTLLFGFLFVSTAIYRWLLKKYLF
jgi:hypothetical protein